MNSKSQLDWFYTLPNLVKTSSSLPKVKWQIANRARVNIVRLGREHPESTEAAIAFLLFQDLQQSVQGDVVVENWTAFLSRYSEQAALKVRRTTMTSGMISSKESITAFEDYFLIALSFSAEPISFLKNFSHEEVPVDVWYKVLHGYCREKAWGKLVDRLRSKKGSKTFMRSDLGLAAKHSESKISESLNLMGIKDAEFKKYLFVWRCFIEVKKAHGISTRSPKPGDFQLIIERINYLLTRNESDRLLFPTPILPDAVEAWLKQVGKAVRFNIDGKPTLSLDKSASEDNQTSLLDMTPDDASNNDLALIEQNSTMDEITADTDNYLNRVDFTQWIVMFLREEVDLKQADIATMVGCAQKTVSQKYRKSWQGLLQEIIAKHQPDPEAYTQLSSETITDLKEGLKNPVKSYFQSVLQTYLQSSAPNRDLMTVRELVKFLQHRSKNKSLTVNSDLEQKLANFLETASYLTDNSR